MNILDENILESQRRLLLDWRIPVRQIGHEIGRKGLKDREIISLLLQLRRTTFLTLDSDFYNRSLCHTKYGLFQFDVRKHEVAIFTRRLFHHPVFNTVVKRMGKVARVSSIGITLWHLHAEKEVGLNWPD